MCFHGHMAAGGHFSEHAAYTKLLLRLTMCGTKVMRRLLNAEIKRYGQTTVSFVASRKETLLKDIVGKMNKTVLFPLDNKPTDVDRWDICLLVHVLKTSCCNLPPSLIQSLQELKTIRNIIAHSEDATLSETQFNDCWGRTGDILEDAMVVINDRDFRNEIEKNVQGIENGYFVQDVAEYQRVINQWYHLDTLMVQKLEELKEGWFK